MKLIKLICKIAILIIIAIFPGCGSSDRASDVKIRIFLFGLHGDVVGTQDFVAVTSDSTVIAAINGQLAKPVDERMLHINGKIEHGNGGHNLQWNWSFTPNQWILAEASTAICDASPLAVEQNIDFWISNIGYFCPWVSYVKSELTSTQ